MTSPKIERAIVSVSDKTALNRAGPGAGRGWRGDLRQRRQPTAPRRGRHRGQRGGRLHRFPRNDGGPAQDAPSQNPRRHPLPTRLRGRHGRGGRARHRAVRTRGGEPLSVPGDHRPRGRHGRRGDREDRIGGPTLVRAAAKNHAFVTIACQPSQYGRILEQIESGGATTPEFRRELAGAAFAHTAKYDTAIATYFAELNREAALAAGIDAPDDRLPGHDHALAASRGGAPLRREPAPAAALYALPDAEPGSLVKAQNLHGKNSPTTICSIWKARCGGPHAALARRGSAQAQQPVRRGHRGNAGRGDTPRVGRRSGEARSARCWASTCGRRGVGRVPGRAGPVRRSDPRTRILRRGLRDPHHQAKWKKNVRLLAIGPIEPGRGGLQLRQVSGGMLAQAADDLPDDTSAWEVVSDTQPTDAQRAELEFAWTVCRHVKSNAIVLCQTASLVGAGAGPDEPRRFGRDRHPQGGRPGPRVGARLRRLLPVRRLDPPGGRGRRRRRDPARGSRGDESVIAACNQHGLPMIFTGRRHFRH